MAKSRPPCLHPIAYVQEGLLNLGLLLGEEQYIDAVIRSVSPLIRQLESAGTLSGEYDENWRPAARWRCLVGEAQLAVVLFRLARQLPQYVEFHRSGQRILDQLAPLADVNGPHAETRGTLAGSHPVWGKYAPWFLPNWSAKFLLDSLLLGLHGVDSQQWNLSPGHRE